MLGAALLKQNDSYLRKGQKIFLIASVSDSRFGYIERNQVEVYSRIAIKKEMQDLIQFFQKISVFSELDEFEIANIVS